MSAPTIYTLAYTGAAVRLDGVPIPVAFDLAGMRKPTKQVPILRQHNHEKIVGHSERVVIGSSTIEAWGVASGCGLPDGREVVATAARGFPWKVSVGVSILRADRYDARETVKVNGFQIRGPVLVARESVLMEISVVPVAADDNSRVVIGPTSAQAGREPQRARPAPKPAPAAASKPTGSIVGMAVIFDQWMAPTMNGQPYGTQVRFSRNAFDQFLARVKRGNESVPLWFDHLDGTETASTADGSLRVYPAGAGLLFSVSGSTAKGQVAINLARKLTDTRSVSIGARMKEFTESTLGRVKRFDVTEAELSEISLVEEGACPGVWVQVE